MVNTCSATHNQPFRLTPSAMARRQWNSPQPIQNLPFHHRYDNLPERLSDTPHPSPTWAPQENPSDPDPRLPDDEGNGKDNNSNNSNPDSVHTPVPEPGSKAKAEPKDTGKALTKALTHIVEFVDPDKLASPRIMVKEPNQFDGSNQQKLRGFLLNYLLVIKKVRW